MIHYVVPARKGSKGLPFKNRVLINHLDYEDIKEDLVVYTDDEVIQQYCDTVGLRFLDRPHFLSIDTTSPKELMVEYCKDLPENDIVVMLYLTYPERTYKDLEKALEFFKSSNASSMLCRKEVKVSPFLMMLEKDHNKGLQLMKHDYYRRQDYPPCFEISHFICAFRVSELGKLNSNMYNDDTVYYPIDDKVDVDHQQDYDKYKSNS